MHNQIILPWIAVCDYLKEIRKVGIYFICSSRSAEKNTFFTNHDLELDRNPIRIHWFKDSSVETQSVWQIWPSVRWAFKTINKIFSMPIEHIFFSWGIIMKLLWWDFFEKNHWIRIWEAKWQPLTNRNGLWEPF